MAFLLTRSIGETPASSDTAIKTPEIGETVRPIEADKFIGKIKNELDTSYVSVILLLKGAKAKNEAFPLPIIIEETKINKVIIIASPTTPKPMF